MSIDVNVSNSKCTTRIVPMSLHKINKSFAIMSRYKIISILWTQYFKNIDFVLKP